MLVSPTTVHFRTVLIAFDLNVIKFILFLIFSVTVLDIFLTHFYDLCYESLLFYFVVEIKHFQVLI